MRPQLFENENPFFSSYEHYTSDEFLRLMYKGSSLLIHNTFYQIIE